MYRGAQTPNYSPEDHDAMLRTNQPDIAAAIDAAKDPPLSNLAKRVLLLVAQVPPGRYTTYIALADYYMSIWGMTSRRNMGAPLKKEKFWSFIPVHRVVAKNASIGSSVEWGDHGQPVDDRIKMLENEGVRFDSRGKILGSTFTDFR